MSEEKRADEIVRLKRALQVCEHTLHRPDPSDAEMHAAQQASGAWSSDWKARYVRDDLPGWKYR